MAATEIMGLRDWRLSERHRQWGWDTPSCDLDFVLIEYDSAMPKALAEYKHCSPSGNSKVEENASIRAFRMLAHMAGLPAWVAFYRPWSWSFKVFSLNDAAREIWGAEEYVVLTELEYVAALYRLRGRSLPDFVAARCNQSHDTLPGLDADFNVLKRTAAYIVAAEEAIQGAGCAA